MLIAYTDLCIHVCFELCWCDTYIGNVSIIEANETVVDKMRVCQIVLLLFASFALGSYLRLYLFCYILLITSVAGNAINCFACEETDKYCEEDALIEETCEEGVTGCFFNKLGNFQNFYFKPSKFKYLSQRETAKRP